MTRAGPGRWAIAIAGAVALAVAMGIGRFAFTPLLPMMLHDGLVDLPTASWLASANYLGYLAGALLCTFQPWLWARNPRLPAPHAPALIRGGLVATGLLTLGMALPWPAAWPFLRFAAGVASAVVFVYTSGWCLAQLAARGAAATGGAIFTGPGLGIVASGLAVSAMVAAQWRAATAWLLMAALAFMLVALVWRIFVPAPAITPEAAATQAPADRAAEHGTPEKTVLAAAYGLAGFGYIVTATFLPVIARAALPGSPWIDMFWPIFGAGVVTGALLSTRLRITGDMRLLLAGGYAMQALAIAVGIWWPTARGFALSSLMLGVPFTAITFFAMQEARRLKPMGAASFMGLLTATYGLGQIVGPPLVAWLLRHSVDPGTGFARSLEVAASALLIGSAIYLWMARTFPLRSGVAGDAVRNSP